RLGRRRGAGRSGRSAHPKPEPRPQQQQSVDEVPVRLRHREDDPSHELRHPGRQRQPADRHRSDHRVQRPRPQDLEQQRGDLARHRQRQQQQLVRHLLRRRHHERPAVRFDRHLHLHERSGRRVREVSFTMKTIDRWNGIALAAILGACGVGCTLTSGNASGTGGSTDGGATTGTGGSTGSGGSTTACPAATPTTGYMGTSGGTATTMRPCDIYAADGGPCVAAHSTVRALYGAYNGFLYQVRKADCTVKDIGVVSPGGLASSTDQDAFCGSGACSISLIYDQSGMGNHLIVAPVASKHPAPYNEANAKSAPITVSGQKVYGIHIVPGIGYRNNAPTGTARGDNAETEYMVAGAGTFNGGCCFDYGNMETNSRDDGEGTMEAVYFGKCITWNEGGGAGPWVMGDLEN